MANKDKLDLLSSKLIDSWYQDVSASEKEVLVFGLKILLSTLIGYTLIFLVGSILKVGLLALVVAATAGAIKIFSGGVHASSFFKCITSGAVIFTGLAFVAQSITSYIAGYVLSLLWIIFLVGSVLINFYAPAVVEEKPITSQVQAARYKLYAFGSFFVVVLGYYIFYLTGGNQQIVVAGLLGMTWQLFTLTPVAYKLYNRQYISIAEVIERRGDDEI
ncbi:MAG: accessory gene regulator ArgB-like protein [Bacillota bacterium]